jgi:hypothetical protein
LFYCFNFRTKLNEEKYGFDFDLYANIVANECSASVKAEMVLIVLKKEIEGMWPRFLSKPNKVRNLLNSK